MAWPAQRGVPCTVRHAVRDLAGILVTGQAGSLSRALSDPAGGASGLATSVAEVGATGWYLITFTPDAAGPWVLTVTNPAAPVGDGQDTEYPIAVGEFGLPGVPLVGYGLTDLATVRTFLKFKDTETKWNELLELLIDSVTSDLEQRARRHFGLYSYTEVLHGHDLDTLYLDQGPLVSVVSVEELTYSAAGVAATALAAWQFKGLGQAVTLGDDARARVRRLDGQCFTAGRDNWRVVYSAGWADLPPALTLDATRMVVAYFRGSDLEGLVSQGAADLSTTPIGPQELDRMAQRIGWKWSLRPEAI